MVLHGESMKRGKKGPGGIDPVEKNPVVVGLFRFENDSDEKKYEPERSGIQGNSVIRACTNFVCHEYCGMKKNVTVVMDEETARWVRVEAARSDLSVSAFLGRVLKKEREKDEGYRGAMERFLSREPRPLAAVGIPLPSRAELHER